MATELAFAKSFLSLLDSKPTKITADHVEDPRNYPASTPYTLPRHATLKPLSKRKPTTTTATKSSSAAATRPSGNNNNNERSITVTVRSLRTSSSHASSLELTLPAPHGARTSVAEVKEAVAAETGLPVDKIKLLFAKKPVADSKLLKDIVPGLGEQQEQGQEQVEFSVMILGGAVPVPKSSGGSGQSKSTGMSKQTAVEEDGAGPVAQGLSGLPVLQTEEFWGDLKGFLQQRVRDEGVAGEACEVFRGAWKGR